MPAPGASVEALAAMMCTAAQGDVGAGRAPIEIAEAISMNPVDTADNIVVLVSCRLFLLSIIYVQLHRSADDLWGETRLVFTHAKECEQHPSMVTGCGLTLPRLPVDCTRTSSPVLLIYLFLLAKSTCFFSTFHMMILRHLGSWLLFNCSRSYLGGA